MASIYQLIEFYYRHDRFQDNPMGIDDAMDYHQAILDKKAIVSYEENDELLGYAEFWRINNEQLGRIVLGQNFSAKWEDINSGTICYLSNVTVRPDKRGLGVIRELRNKFFEANKDCDYFIGYAKRKKTQPWKIFTKQQAYMKYVKQEIQNGKQ